MKIQYGKFTNFLFWVENKVDLLRYQLMHLRVQSQLRDINGVRYDSKTGEVFGR